MASQAKQKLLIVGGVSFMICAVGITTVYLPFFSQAALDGKELRDQLANESRNKPTGSGGSRGSMWGNLDKEIKKS